jgi:hypothetical protein
MAFHFLCTTNPTGPLLVLDSEFEANEMKSHPDYVLVDENRQPREWPNTTPKGEIRFSSQQPAQQPAKRPVLGLPKKK